MQMLSKNTVTNKFTFEAKGFKPAELESAILCIEIGKDFFNYALFSKNKDVLALKSMQSQQYGVTGVLPSLFIESDKLLQHSFSKVYISVADVPYTIVPNAFYAEEDKASYLHFATGAQNNQTILSDDISHSESKLIYSIDKNIKEQLDKYYPNHHLISTISNQLNNIPVAKKNKAAAYLNFRRDSVDLILVKDKVVFCNSFSVISPEDLIYFVLSSLELNNFEVQDTQFVIYGETETNSLWIKLMKKYIKHIDFAGIEKQFKKPLEINNMPSHYYYHLINLIHCA
jgi:hypothetical protein